MSARLPTVDKNGNINIHILEDIYIPVLGSAGADLSQRSLWFEVVDQNISIQLQQHPSDPFSRLIFLTNSQIRRLPRESSFVLLDKTGYVRAKWSGKIKRFQ